MIMTGEPLDSAGALQIGLIDEIAEPQDVLSTAMTLATRLAELAPHAVQTAKYLIDRSVETDLATALELERRMVPLMATPEQLARARRDAAARSPVYARLFAPGMTPGPADASTGGESFIWAKPRPSRTVIATSAAPVVNCSSSATRMPQIRRSDPVLFSRRGRCSG